MIVFVLRHAEKKLTPENADDLTPAGVERAELLGRMLAETGVSVAYCSKAVRAQRTLEPLKATLGAALTMNPIAIDGPGQPDKHVDTIVNAVKLLGGDPVVVVVSHSDTVRLIVKALGGGTVEKIEEWEFDKLFVLFIPPTGAPMLVRLRYGAAT
jgi:phosphohistidine phosphatase SixA